MHARIHSPNVCMHSVQVVFEAHELNTSSLAKGAGGADKVLGMFKQGGRLKTPSGEPLHDIVP